ncbi:hypothetical protein QEN19_003191 [Hanseniaspora menglaensis]
MVNANSFLLLATLGLTAKAAVVPPQAQLQQAFNLGNSQEDILEMGLSSSSVEDDGSYFQDSWKFHLPYFLKPTVETESLQSKITLESLNKSANALYHIAEKSVDEYGHPTRVIGSKGHWATLDWIKKRMSKLSYYYDISEQDFDAVYGRVKSASITFEDGTPLKDVKGMSLTPGVESFLGHVIEIPNLGCDLEDFLSVAPVKKNGIALIERGQCPFGDKSKNAKLAGFKSAIIYNNEKGEKAISGTLGDDVNSTIATVGIPLKQGEQLKAAILKSKNKLYVDYAVDAYVQSIKTTNLVVETKKGDPNNIVSLGAHTDGVETGPGINDDGTGTISLLTVAEQLAGYKINNKVRFMFVAAEEEGLLGSAYYANSLNEDENSKVRLMMDYDMMASPNFQFQVYDANNIDNPKGSEEIKNLYIDYYVSHGFNYTLIPFDGRSDYVGFLDVGIPAGGIAAGAEGINTDNGEVLDKCYHELCDDVSNLNFDAFLVNTRLIAHSVATYARDLSEFPLREVTERKSEQYQYSASNLLF